jgi:hypothetical protein
MIWKRRKEFFNVKDKATCNFIFNLKTVGRIKSSNSAKNRLLIETEHGNINEID